VAARSGDLELCNVMFAYPVRKEMAGGRGVYDGGTKRVCQCGKRDSTTFLSERESDRVVKGCRSERGHSAVRLTHTLLLLLLSCPACCSAA
jgi:hypothetical protein